MKSSESDVVSVAHTPTPWDIEARHPTERRYQVKAELQRNVGGVELEAVRFQTPIPHWRIKVVQTGYVFEAGVFPPSGGPLKDIWYGVEKTARLTQDRWINETLTAHL